MAPRPNLPDLSPAYEIASREARRLCRSLSLQRHEQEDIQQDLLADFLTRLPAYDPAKAELAAFAMVCMRHAGMGWSPVDQPASRVKRARVMQGRRCAGFSAA
jgi:DNA-directed RNA polymerase specialized sigma24 family protein